MQIPTLLFSTLLMLGNSGEADANIRHYNSASLDCLTRNIYYEAGNQSAKGKQAVGHVTMNRLKRNYANSVCGVVYQPKQFSWTKHRKLNKVNMRQWDQSREIALSILNGSLRDNTAGSTHFHATYTHPRWRGVQYVATIGQHMFYRK
jgi:spore germination cell wall hydrolase CwlJ-like protein